jgi:hypothetical protein
VVGVDKKLTNFHHHLHQTLRQQNLHQMRLMT